MEESFERSELEKEQRNPRSKDATCPYCGETRLRWKKDKGVWKLFEKNRPHRCSEGRRWK